jgi:hypothetical protein
VVVYICGSSDVLVTLGIFLYTYLQKKKIMELVTAVIILLVMLGVMITVVSVALLKYIDLYRIQTAIQRAWFNPGVCEAEGIDCVLKASQKLPEFPGTWGEDFNPTLARWCADYVARIELATLEHLSVPTDHEKVAVMIPDSGPPFGVIFMRDKIMTIAFRATATKYEIQDDLDAWQVSWKDGSIYKYGYEKPLTYELIEGTEALVHSGFREVFQSYMGTIESTIKEYQPSELIVCGHSLGGAVCTLVCEQLGKTLEIPISGYVFGTPRVGNSAFNDLLHARALKCFWRVVNSADNIQDMPLLVTPNFRDPSQKPLFYVHAGPAYTYTANWGSWRHNHFLMNYIYHLDSII